MTNFYDFPNNIYVVNIGTFTVVKNANITVNGNTTATDISTSSPMLNIPQELTTWAVSGASKTKAGAAEA